MSITPVSSGSNTAVSPFGDNNIIKLLEKQKMQLQEQIQKTNESRMDDKTKKEMIKQLQDQIQQIDMEIQQKRAEKLSINQNANSNPYASGNSVNPAGEDGGNMAGMPELIQAGAIYSQEKLMSGMKNNMMGKGRILKKEIEIDEARSLSGAKAVAKRQELQKLEASSRGIDKKMAEASQAVRKSIDEAADKVTDSSDKSNEEIKVEETEKKQEQKGNENTYRKIDIKI